jgi:hypothetical protein
MPQAMQMMSYTEPVLGVKNSHRVMVPVGWRTQFEVRWEPQVIDDPAHLVARFTSPRQVEQFEEFGSVKASQMPDPSLLPLTSGAGQGRFGPTYWGREVLPVMEPLDAIQAFFLPRYRPDLSRARVAARAADPELAEYVYIRAGLDAVRRMGMQPLCSAARMRFEYDWDGVPVEEQVYAVVVGRAARLNTGVLVTWAVEFFSYRAGKGQLDAMLPVFNRILCSFHVDPVWLSKYSAIIGKNLQSANRRVMQAAEINRIARQMADNISDTIQEMYQNRQEAMDRASAKWHEYYNNSWGDGQTSDGRRATVPLNARGVWMDRSGRVITSDDPNFYPGDDWERVRRQ